MHRRPVAFWGLANWLLAAAAAPLFLAFVGHHDGIASLGDDSVSYLMLAGWFAGSGDPLLAPWMPFQTRFPPLFPLALALTGGGNPLAAHLLVGAFAALCVALLARYASFRLGSPPGGVAIAVAFLILPTAWISVKGILSESMYLAITLVALHYHGARFEREPPGIRAAVILGLLLAAVVLTRAAGIALLAAYALRTGIAWILVGERRMSALVPVVAPIALLALWAAVRPGGGEYNVALARAAEIWLRDPAGALGTASVAYSGGWLASFFVDSGVGAIPRVLAGCLAAAALAGAARAAARNRLDGWYVLAAAALLFVLPYGEDNTRRMFYPLLPIALIHAAEAVRDAAVALGVRRSGAAAAAVLALMLAPSLPAALGVAQRTGDRTVLVPGSRYRAADLTEYYTTVNLQQARTVAAQQAAVLGGLESLATHTSPDARIMWMRPEYVAFLGRRNAVASYFAWDALQLATEIRAQGVDFIVISALYKSDLHQRAGDPATTLHDVRPYVIGRTRIANPLNGQDEFLLLEIDRGALDAYLAQATKMTR